MARGRADGGLATTHSTPDLFSIVTPDLFSIVTPDLFSTVLMAVKRVTSDIVLHCIIFRWFVVIVVLL